MNNVVISGRLTATPELKKTPSNLSVVNFCVAVRKNKESANFIDCVAWEKTADLIKQYFKKGDFIEVSGILQTRTFEQNGAKRKVTEVLANQIGFGGGKNAESEIVEIEEGELPF